MKTVTEIYANKKGEMFAFVSALDDGVYRIVENIERFGYDADMLYESAARGFDNFPEFDPEEHDGFDFRTVSEDMILDNDLYFVGAVTDIASGCTFTRRTSAASALLTA